MAAQTNTLAIDFGTSNSAAGYMRAGKPCLIAVEPDNLTLPTSVFFDFDSRKTLFGSPANGALIDGEYGRFMRALKSVLGTGLLREKRRFLDERLDFIDIISRFLAEIKARAEAESGLVFGKALSGRPVYFHSNDHQKDAQALRDLRECYLAAGFNDVDFMFEPEAAALANHRHLSPGDIGLIVDIGGGTSDFSIIKAGSAGEIEIIISHGLRIGGTDFDRRLSIDHVMPLLGKDSQIRNSFGAETLAAPQAIFNTLATWEKIPFLYTPETRQQAAMLQKLAVEPQKLARLAKVLAQERGHDMAFAVERGKIEANEANAENTVINLPMVESGLKAPLSPHDLDQTLADLTAKIAVCAAETMVQAGMQAKQVDSLIYVGGSSLMHSVESCLQGMFVNATPHRASAFTAVVSGLTLALG